MAVFLGDFLTSGLVTFFLGVTLVGVAFFFKVTFFFWIYFWMGWTWMDDEVREELPSEEDLVLPSLDWMICALWSMVNWMVLVLRRVGAFRTII